MRKIEYGETVVNSELKIGDDTKIVLQLKCVGEKDEIDYITEKLKQRANGKGYKIICEIV
jgi:hypothetical protein